MDFDWNRFGALQVLSVVSLITLLGLVVIGVKGGAQGFYWIAIIANVLLVFFATFYVSYPRKDGSWRGIGEHPEH